MMGRVAKIQSQIAEAKFGNNAASPTGTRKASCLNYRSILDMKLINNNGDENI